MERSTRTSRTPGPLAYTLGSSPFRRRWFRSLRTSHIPSDGLYLLFFAFSACFFSFTWRPWIFAPTRRLWDVQRDPARRVRGYAFELLQNFAFSSTGKVGIIPRLASFQCWIGGGYAPQIQAWGISFGSRRASKPWMRDRREEEQGWRARSELFGLAAARSKAKHAIFGHPLSARSSKFYLLSTHLTSLERTTSIGVSTLSSPRDEPARRPAPARQQCRS
ncbi:hypothetical protein B0H15DRAFT_569065 [Mycena belliarum]|uniref:Uncharacterized protein n=1 Tax=Mycena belliarum TaxID=1033014 RepID=A0AAD6TWV5_9AGAR|nr:hypothetical protein B0H15DRAFT_569065 [Mycena belliae]